MAELVSDAFERVSRRRFLPPVLAITALESDVRMLVQQSAFTIHRTARDLRERSAQRRLLRQFIIPRGQKPQLREWLALAGMETATVFPDLSGLAKSIERDFRD